MARTISQRELRNDSGMIMRGLDEGETFIVTRRGVPVGELIPVRRRRFVQRDRFVELFQAAPPLDRRRLIDDLDERVDQTIEARG